MCANADPLSWHSMYLGIAVVHLHGHICLELQTVPLKFRPLACMFLTIVTNIKVMLGSMHSQGTVCRMMPSAMPCLKPSQVKVVYSRVTYNL